MARRHSALFLASLMVLVHSTTGVADIEKGGPGVLIPAEGGERFSPEYGGVLLLKVGPQNSGATQLIVGTLDLPAGASLPTHRHDGDEEVLYVLEGEIAVVLNNRELRAKKGDTVFIPMGTWMTVRNSGATVAKLLGIVPRAGMEKCMQLLHGKSTESSSAVRSHEGIPDVCHMSAPPPKQPN